MILVQFGPSRGGLLLRLCDHFNRGVERIAQLRRGNGTASQMPSGAESHFYRSIGAWDQNAGSQFNLNSSVQGAVGSGYVEVDKGSAMAVLKNGSWGGSIGNIHFSFQSSRRKLRGDTI
jgi:hypothetical protein